ncbi:MAG: TIGR03435 family protein [Terracidiphilus sp.]
MRKRFFSVFTSMAKLTLLVAGSIALAMPAFAQSAPQDVPANTLAYDVVSVKPHQTTSNGGMSWQTTSDGFSASGIGLENLITTAYGLVMPDQIAGLPGWAHSDTFDIEAKMDEDTAAAMKKLPKPEFRRAYLSMMQSLLADRFQLKVHHETRELPVYNLVIAKGGSKMKEAAAGEKGWMSMSSKQMSATAVDTHSLTFSLANDVGPLRDRQDRPHRQIRFHGQVDPRRRAGDRRFRPRHLHRARRAAWVEAGSGEGASGYDRRRSHREAFAELVKWIAGGWPALNSPQHEGAPS